MRYVRRNCGSAIQSDEKWENKQNQKIPGSHPGGPGQRLTKCLRCEGCENGCRLAGFETKIPNLGKFWMALDWKMLIYVMAIWNIFHTLGIIYDLLVHFLFIWYIFAVLVECTKKTLATQRNSCLWALVKFRQTGLWLRAVHNCSNELSAINA
jgi:hypothetical protein